jgi:hypothetical protein
VSTRWITVRKRTFMLAVVLELSGRGRGQSRGGVREPLRDLRQKQRAATSPSTLLLPKEYSCNKEGMKLVKEYSVELYRVTFSSN